MAKIGRLAPYTNAKQIRLEITRNDWIEIEASYGNEIPPDLRGGIETACRQYLSLAAEEYGTVSIAPAISRAKRIQRATIRLMALLERRHSFRKTAPELYADIMISGHLNDGRRDKKYLKPDLWHVALEPQVQDLELLNNACASALAEMSATQAYWQKGSAWGTWIVTLTELVRGYDLPVAASKTIKKEGADTYSRFTHLIRRLQIKFPKEFRRGSQSLDALTEDIKRARRSEKIAYGTNK